MVGGEVSACMGVTILPHSRGWQSDHTVEEETREHLKLEEVWLGEGPASMDVSNHSLHSRGWQSDHAVEEELGEEASQTLDRRRYGWGRGLSSSYECYHLTMLSTAEDGKVMVALWKRRLGRRLHKLESRGVCLGVRCWMWTAWCVQRWLGHGVERRGEDLI